MKVFVEPIGVTVEVARDQTLLSAVSNASVGVPVDCGGRGTCGKCLVRLGSGELTPPTAAELGKVPADRLAQGWRLACQAMPVSSRVSIEVVQTGGRRQILTASRLSHGDVRPAVARSVVKLARPSFEDARSDAARLEDELGLRVSALSLLGTLPVTLREGRFTATVTTSDGALIDVEPGVVPDHAFGAAVDIGTSKIITYLFDLQDGRVVDQEALENPQMRFGEDVITRITEALDRPRLLELASLAREGINTTLDILCRRQELQSRHIYDATVVGNTAMHHLALGLSPVGLTRAPFAPAVDRPVAVRAAELGLAMNPEAWVYFPPPIAGFVGSDCLAVIAATRLQSRRAVSMAIDIGTNTEIALVHDGELSVTSCASGPAFEGYQITCGMKAAVGAIERLTFRPDGRPRLARTIGGAPPLGICGSGVVDLLAGLLSTGVVDSSGLMREHPLVREGAHGLEYVLAHGPNGDIVFTQHDVRALQLAKGAIATGWTLLLEHGGLAIGDLRRVYVAGAFGNYLELRNALAIGLLPPIGAGRISFVGNAAGVGAQIALVDERQRLRMADLRRGIEFRELATDPRFHETFLRLMSFAPQDGDGEKSGL